jgi:hypothetical protein
MRSILRFAVVIKIVLFSLFIIITSSAAYADTIFFDRKVSLLAPQLALMFL